jgi:hypothetical protein
VDRIEFVVAKDELGMGTFECAEPVVNGESLIDIIRRVEEREPLGYAGYAGLVAPKLVAALLDCLAAPGAAACSAQVLGCTCGDAGCSWAVVEVVTTDHEVVWQNVQASRFASSPEVYAPVGPFRFRRAEYEESLRRPQHAAAPLHRPHE